MIFGKQAPTQRMPQNFPQEASRITGLHFVLTV
jgi:hypothetical protein